MAITFMEYDPLVVDEDDSAGAADAAPADAGGDDWGTGGGGGGGEWADAGGEAAPASSDDTSWKVRRSAVGVLDAFIRMRYGPSRRCDNECATVCVVDL
jgi:hypothetical protein